MCVCLCVSVYVYVCVCAYPGAGGVDHGHLGQRKITDLALKKGSTVVRVALNKGEMLYTWRN
jgi:hypothetical protein